MMGPVNDFLVVYLDSIDERLLEYLDEDEELKLDAVQRLRFYTTALLDGSITPDHVMEDWPDWYQLVPAFVATYGSEELGEPHQGRRRLPKYVGGVARYIPRDADHRVAKLSQL